MARRCVFCLFPLPTPIQQRNQEIHQILWSLKRRVSMISHGRENMVAQCASREHLESVHFVILAKTLILNACYRVICYLSQTPGYPRLSLILWYADGPEQAMQYMLNTSAYNVYKPSETRAAISLTVGKGIVWAEGCRLCLRIHRNTHLATLSTGMQHSRQRKIMNPAFSYSALRGFLPVFHGIAKKVRTVFAIYFKTGCSCVVDCKQYEGVRWPKRTVICCSRSASLGGSCDSWYYWYQWGTLACAQERE